MWELQPYSPMRRYVLQYRNTDQITDQIIGRFTVQSFNRGARVIH